MNNQIPTGQDRFRIYIAAYLYLVKDDNVLMLLRENTGYNDGNYSLVAGHLDGEETAKHSIIREAAEEANINLDPQNLAVTHVMHRYSPDREYIDVYLKAEAFSGQVKNLEPHKCAELKWFPLSKLPGNIIPEVKFALDQIGQNNFYSEFGWQCKG